jgi:membrane-bound lytic murein transglycosylase A
VNGSFFPNSGRSMRKLDDGSLVPYYDRAQIEDGALDGRRLEICWLRDGFDLLNIQIQGSGRVRLEDGTMLRLNYDSHNGHPYTPVGRILIERQLVPRDEMSMGRIRDWMQTNPAEANELRRQNKSFVFFRIVGLSDDREATGAQGVPLTPTRSIAVDKGLHVYGTPFFIEADLPIRSARAETRFQRLMIAQDTGSAIVGPARADVYYGAGDEAGRIAGRFRHPGRFALLIPREIDPVVAGARMPMPMPRPTATEKAVAGKKGKGQPPVVAVAAAPAVAVSAPPTVGAAAPPAVAAGSASPVGASAPPVVAATTRPAIASGAPLNARDMPTGGLKSAVANAGAIAQGVAKPDNVLAVDVPLPRPRPKLHRVRSRGRV